MADEIRFRRRIEDEGFSVLYHVLTLDRELSDSAFRLYSLLLKYAQQKGKAWPGVPRLAEDLGKGERTISRLLDELQKRGLISRQRRFGTSTITYIEDPNEIYGDLLAQTCESAKNGRTEEHDPAKNGRFVGDDPAKNGRTILPNLAGKEKEEKNNKSGEEEKEKEPVHLSENEEKEASIWQAALGELQLQMTKPTFDTWVRDTRLVACQDDIFVVSVQDEFTREWLENRLSTTIERTLVGIMGRQVSVKFVVEGCIT